MASPWQRHDIGLHLRVHVQPRASQNRLVGFHGDAIKIALTAPPVDGAANTALLRFLASLLALRPADVTLLSGQSSREKQVLISTTNVDQTIRALEDLLRRVDKKNLDG